MKFKDEELDFVNDNINTSINFTKLRNIKHSKNENKYKIESFHFSVSSNINKYNNNELKNNKNNKGLTYNNSFESLLNKKQTEKNNFINKMSIKKIFNKKYKNKKNEYLNNKSSYMPNMNFISIIFQGFKR